MNSFLVTNKQMLKILIHQNCRNICDEVVEVGKAYFASKLFPTSPIENNAKRRQCDLPEMRNTKRLSGICDLNEKKKSILPFAR